MFLDSFTQYFGYEIVHVLSKAMLRGVVCSICYCRDIPHLFVHCSRHLGCSWFRTIMSDAVMNIFIHVFWYIYV